MSADALLTEADQEEALSLAYVRAVAAGAGYSTTQDYPDRSGVDLRINAGGNMQPAIDVQLKATVNLRKAEDGFLRFRLKTSNYKRLRSQTQTPSLLVILDLPVDKEEWISVRAEELVLRRYAYWLNLVGAKEGYNASSVTVPIPKGNVFNVGILRKLMDQSRKREILGKIL